MTTELTKAAQAALNACERIVDQEESPVQFGIDFRALGSSLRRALTQRPAAQEVDERAAFETWAKQRGFQRDELDRCRIGIVGPRYYNANTEMAWEAWQARASLPAPQQATPDDSFVVISYRTNDISLEPTKDFQRIDCKVNGIDGTLEARRVNENTVDIGRVVAFADEQATPEPVGGHDMAGMLERGAKAWAGVDPQDLRAGGTPEPVLLNGLTEAETNATASVMGLTATPEPVGEPDTVPLDALHAAERERDYWKTRARAMLDHAEGTCWYWMGDGEDHLESLVSSLPVVIRADQLRELLARPAPGVPEGWRDAKNDPPPVGVDVLVAVEFDGPGDWRIKVGGRNPQERTGWCVFGASWVPQVWMPLDAHRAMLAAAQAKGGEHA